MTKVAKLEVRKNKSEHVPGTLKHGFRTSNLSPSVLDGRTRLARGMRALEKELIASLGGDPSVQQQLLIQQATFLAARIALFQEAFLNGEIDDTAQTSAKFVSYVNSLRLILTAVGLERKTGEVPSLKEYLTAKYGERKEGGKD